MIDYLMKSHSAVGDTSSIRFTCPNNELIKNDNIIIFFILSFSFHSDNVTNPLIVKVGSN